MKYNYSQKKIRRVASFYIVAHLASRMTGFLYLLLQSTACSNTGLVALQTPTSKHSCMSESKWAHDVLSTSINIVLMLQVPKSILETFRGSQACSVSVDQNPILLYLSPMYFIFCQFYLS